MDYPQNNVLQSEPMMKHPIPSHTMKTGLNALSPISKHSEVGFKSLNEASSVKPWTSLKSNVKPHQISEKPPEPRLLKVSKADAEMLFDVVMQGRYYIQGKSK